MNSASNTAFPECNDGNAPNTSGDEVNFVVYISKPSNWSTRANPAGDPGIE